VHRSPATNPEQLLRGAKRGHGAVLDPADPKKDLQPRPGDIWSPCGPPPATYRLQPGDFQHVRVIVDATGDLWRTADTGQGPDGPKGDDGKLLILTGTRPAIKIANLMLPRVP
jgi:hypothetical protein